MTSPGDEIPERDVTYHLIWLLIYQWTTNRTTHSLPVLSNAYLLHIMNVCLRKAPWAQTTDGRGRRPPTTIGVRKLEWLPFRVVSKYPQCIALCDHNSPTFHHHHHPQQQLSLIKHSWQTQQCVQCEKQNEIDSKIGAVVKN